MTTFDSDKPYPLTWHELEAYQPSKSRPRDRFFCPAHGGDNQPSVIVDRTHPKSRWKCMNCNAWGYLDSDPNWKPEPKSGTYQQKAKITPAQRPQKAQEGPDRDRWQSQARRFTEWANRELLKRPELITWLETDRQLSPCQVEHHRLGFNPAARFSEPEKWGFPPGKKIYLPPGLVIPYFDQSGQVYGINVRQFKTTDAAPAAYLPDQEPERRYQRIKGTESKPLVFGDLDRPWPVVIVESELDALVLWNHFDCMVNVVALLTVSRRPDLPGAGPILYALDFDSPGKKQFNKWAEKYPNRVHPATPIIGKDITETLKAGVPPLSWLALWLKDAGLLTTKALNPYAHFCLVDALGTVPGHIREQARRPDFALHLWTAAYGLDPESEVRALADYRRAWANI